MKPVCTDRAKSTKGTKGTIHQQFTVPDHAPFLEIRTTLNSTLPYAEHFHSSFSLGLILEGRTCLTLVDEQYIAEKGDMVLIPPGLPHRCNPIGPSARSYHMAYIDANWFDRHVAPVLGLKESVCVLTPIISAPVFFAQALTIIEAVNTDPVNTGHQLIAFFSAIQRHYKRFETVAKVSAYSSVLFLTGGYLIEEKMQKQMDRRYSVTSLAKADGVRRETFSRAFRRQAGMPPSTYLHCLRLEYGRQMLRQGKSIAEAAAASGYVDQSHFHRMFVRYYSVTPGCYRKNRSHPYKK